MATAAVTYRHQRNKSVRPLTFPDRRLLLSPAEWQLRAGQRDTESGEKRRHLPLLFNNTRKSDGVGLAAEGYRVQRQIRSVRVGCTRATRV